MNMIPYMVSFKIEYWKMADEITGSNKYLHIWIQDHDEYDSRFN